MALKPEHKNFIKYYLKTGDHIASYMKAYSTNDRKKAATLGGKLLKNIEVAAEIAKKSTKINEKAEKEAIEELKGEIKGEVLTAIQKRDLLRRIANGEPVNGKKPTVSEMIKAIEVDNKMGGDNAPDKLDHTTKGKQLPAPQYVRQIRVIHTNSEHVNPEETDTDDDLDSRAGDGVDGDK